MAESTIASVNDGSDELVDKAGVEAYGRIVKTQVFDNVNKASTLLENGKRFLESHANIPITFTIRAVDMHLVDTRVEEIYVGDVVHVNSMPHGLAQDLTCTKVEYDIENPSNDVYTFGNPKQTLTERYRKDKNKSNSSAGGGAGGAAGGAGKAAEEKTNELLDKFFDAWINVDKESAHINLGALYQEFQNAKKVLENQVGIDLDAVAGNINIKALKTKYDELEQVTRTQAAQIDLLTSDTESKIELLTSWYDYLEGREDGHYASIVLRANELESAIEMKADRVDVNAVNVNLNALTTRVEGTEKDIKDAKVSISAVSQTVDANGKAIKKNEASITALSNDTKSQIELVTKNIDDKVAYLTLITNDHGSKIAANADKIVLLGKENVSISSQLVTFSNKLGDIEVVVKGKITASELSSQISKLSTVAVNNFKCTGLLWATGTCSLPSSATAGGDQILTSSNWSKYITSATKEWVKEQLDNLTIPWTSVTGKPKSYPPSVVTWDDVVDKPDTFTPSSHKHAWSTITNKPDTFTPKDHKHSISVSLKNTTKPNTTSVTSHTHAYNEVASATGGIKK